MENVLLSSEVDLFVEAIKPFPIIDLGNKQWLEWHYRLQKLNHQATLDIACLKEETVKEALITLQKVDALVVEIITISLWKGKVFPHLLRIEPNPACTFILYAVLYQEATCAALLESILFHPEGCEALKDAAVDLVDYCCNNVAQLFVADVEKKRTTKEEVIEQRDNLQFGIGVRCICIIRYVSENSNNLEISANVRLYTTNDAPLLLAQLVINHPWLKNGRIFCDNRWQEHRNVGGKLCPAETQSWLALRSVLFNPFCAQRYEYTAHLKDTFIKLLPLLTDNVLDQISPLVELKRYLTEISVAGAAQNERKAGFILEIVPQIAEGILKEYEGKWKDIARAQAPLLFPRDREEIQRIASELGEAYNTELSEKFQQLQTNEGNRNICKMCGKDAVQRCSQCKNAWYCSRSCQVKNWKQHKDECL